MARDGVFMYDHLPPEEAVRRAWTDTGWAPYYHMRMKQKLALEWPLLARALNRLQQEATNKPLPLGLCWNREDHEPHEVNSETLGRYWCHADQHRRLPNYLDRENKQ